MPKISIIIPVFNAEKYLTKSLKQLREQTLKDIEIICINDGSTDKSLDILKNIQKQDKRIIVINSKKNLGQSASRNLGLAKAKSPYIMFCDADDWYENSMCEQLYRAIDDSHADIAICGINMLYEAAFHMRKSDESYYGIKYSGMTILTDEKILNTDCAPVNKIFKKSIIEKYNIRFPEGLHYEDAYFFFAYCGVADYAFYIKDKLYNYVRHENSIMSQTFDKKSSRDFAIDHLYIAEKLLQFYKREKVIWQKNDLFWQIFSQYLSLSIYYAKTHKARKEAIKLSKKFIKENDKYFKKTLEKTKKYIMIKNFIFNKRVLTYGFRIRKNIIARRNNPYHNLNELLRLISNQVLLLK